MSTSFPPLSLRRPSPLGHASAGGHGGSSGSRAASSSDHALERSLGSLTARPADSGSHSAKGDTQRYISGSRTHRAMAQAGVAGSLSQQQAQRHRRDPFAAAVAAAVDEEDEEKISPERHQWQSMRGRYSKAHMSDFGQVYDSSDLGSGRSVHPSASVVHLQEPYAFDAEKAEPLSGVHHHRPTPMTLASLRPAGYEPQRPPPQQLPVRGRHYASRSRELQPQPTHATFATEGDATPRDDLNIGSFGYATQKQRHSHAPSTSAASLSGSSAGGPSSSAVAETTGRTIWSMWRRMKEDHQHAMQRERARAAPLSSSAGGSSIALGSGLASPPSSLDYVAAGQSISEQLSKAGVRVSRNHLDVIHNLAGLEKVWLRSSSGLDEGEFVAFLREVLRLPSAELKLLFQKMDANADGSLSWDEYLSYLLIEVTHRWSYGSAKGTWHLKDVDTPPVAVGAQVQQILVAPGDGGFVASGGTSSTTPRAASSGTRYILSCKDNSIQVWSAGTMSYLCHVPPPWRASRSDATAAAMHGPTHAEESQRGRPQGRRGDVSARQKRVGGGGWKRSISRSGVGGTAIGASASSLPSSGGGVVDESVQRRMAHAELARLSMMGDGTGGRFHVHLGTVGSTGGADGRADSKRMLSAPDRDLEGPSNPFLPSHRPSRAAAGVGDLHMALDYYVPQRTLLVACMDKSVHHYQHTHRSYIQVDRTEVINTPQCMSVYLGTGGVGSYQHGSAASRGHSGVLAGDLLIVGDTSGTLSGYHLPVVRDAATEKNGSITIGGMSGIGAQGMGGVGHPAGIASSHSLNSSLLASFSSAPRPAFAFQVHRDGESVRKVSMLPSVGLVSAGMDSGLHISDLETGRLVRSLVGHKRGVYAFAHCAAHRCIISAGFDGKVLVFDPYLSAPIGQLLGGSSQGHGRDGGQRHRQLLDVLVNTQRNQVLTVCADKKIRIFDIRTFKCISTLEDAAEYQPDEYSACAFDEDGQQLVTAGNKIKAWPVVIAPGNKARRGGPAHATLVVSICFSAVFGQLISAGVDEAVHVWDVYTGQSVFEFRTSHGHPLTAACLDHRGKRLITGAHDGSVHMYNFHNGARMAEFESRGKELLALLYLPRTMQCLVGIGYDRAVTRWPDLNAPKGTKWLVQSEHRAGSEVTALCATDSVLITGSSDGELIVWYMDSALVSKRFDVPRSPRSSRRPAITKLLFVDLPHPSGSSPLGLLLAGTDDGSLHFIKLAASETLLSLFELMCEPIIGLAVHHGTTSASDSRPATAFRRSRLMVCDCQNEAKLFDLSSMHAESDLIRANLPLLRSWDLHPNGGTTTDLLALDAVDAFASASDAGDIVLWAAHDGEMRAKFGQRKAWPIADPRRRHDTQRVASVASVSNQADPLAQAQLTSDSSDSDSSDDDEPSDSDDEQDEDGSASYGQPPTPLRGRSLLPRVPLPHSSRPHTQAGSSSGSTTPPARPSYADAHPMSSYALRDDAERGYLQSLQAVQAITKKHPAATTTTLAGHQPDSAIRAGAAGASASAGVGVGRRPPPQCGPSPTGRPRPALDAMLSKLDNDLRHQQQKHARPAA